MSPKTKHAKDEKQSWICRLLRNTARKRGGSSLQPTQQKTEEMTINQRTEILTAMLPRDERS